MILAQRKPNAEMLILARQSRGLTQKELSALLPELKQFTLSKMENGLQSIDKEKLLLIAQALDYPVDFFYQDYIPTAPGISELFHRKRATVPARVLENVHASIDVKCLQLKKLLNSVDLENSLGMPMYSIERNCPENIAKMLRAEWQLPGGAIKSVVGTIENAGGIVIPMDFHTSKIDAISRRLDNNVPIFFADLSKPMDRVRFSLCHELGHMVMHRVPTDSIEEEADEFAAEFLLPRAEVKYDLDDLKFNQLPELKMKWKASMQAIIYRANRLGCINSSRYRRLFMTLSKLGYRTREPEVFDPPKETPTLYNELLKVHLDSLKYSREELKKLLCINNNDLDSMLPSKKPRFRIIK